MSTSLEKLNLAIDARERVRQAAQSTLDELIVEQMLKVRAEQMNKRTSWHVKNWCRGVYQLSLAYFFNYN